MHSFFLWHFCKYLFLQSLQFVLHPYVRQWAWVQHRLPSYQCHQSLSQSEAMPRAELPPEDEWSQVPIVKRVLLLFLLPLWRPKLCLKKPACTATMVVILINYKDHTVHCMCICDWLQGFFSSLHVQTEVFSSISMKRIMMYTSFGCQCRRKQLRRFGGVAGEWFGCIGILKWWCPRCYWIHHEVSLECLACNRCNPQQNYLCIVYISRRYSYICRTLIDSFMDMPKENLVHKPWVRFGQKKRRPGIPRSFNMMPLRFKMQWEYSTEDPDSCLYPWLYEDGMPRMILGLPYRMPLWSPCMMDKEWNYPT